MAKSLACYRCKGWCYADDPYRSKTSIWCLMCGAEQFPDDFKPLPYAAHFDDKLEEAEWYIDDHGDIIDMIDQKIENLIVTNPAGTFNVSAVAKSIHCSNYEARMTLDRLVRIGELETFRYGPQSRWAGYRKVY